MIKLIRTVINHEIYMNCTTFRIYSFLRSCGYLYLMVSHLREFQCIIEMVKVSKKATNFY